MKKLLLTTAAIMLAAPSVSAATYCVRPVISVSTGATLYCTRDLSLDPSDPACTCGGNLAGDDEGAGMNREFNQILIDWITPAGLPVDPDDDLDPPTDDGDDEPVDDGDDEPVDDGDDEPVDDGDDDGEGDDDSGDDGDVGGDGGDDGDADDGEEDDGDNGHGNDDDHDDDSNPGKGDGHNKK